MVTALTLYFTAGDRKVARVPFGTPEPGGNTDQPRAALSITLQGDLSALPAAKAQELRDVASRTFAAYSAGSYSKVSQAITAIRQEIPSAWDPSFDPARADAELSWFYNSFKLNPGSAQVVVHVGNGRVRIPDDDEMARNGQNVARGTHKGGLSVFTEPNTKVPRDEYEVILPYTHTSTDGSNQSGRFGVRFLWSDVQKRWVQIGMANYGFKVGQTIPMIPY
jgi:hypothetical protein